MNVPILPPSTHEDGYTRMRAQVAEAWIIYMREREKMTEQERDAFLQAMWFDPYALADCP